jgi:hypothetical protein
MRTNFRAMKPEKKLTGTGFTRWRSGCFSGWRFWKFGNPVILDHKIIPPPVSPFSEFWNGDAWPTHWANWIFPAARAGRRGLVAFTKRESALAGNAKINWLWLLPLLWFGWQLISATQTVDADLTADDALASFSAASRAIFIGALVLDAKRALRLAAGRVCWRRSRSASCGRWTSGCWSFRKATRCWWKANATGWTNMPPEMLLEMKQEPRRHHHQRRGRGEPGHPRQICQRARHGHAGLSQRAGGRFPAAAAAVVDAGIRQQKNCARRSRPIVIAWLSFWAARDFSGAARSWAG